MVNVWQMKSGCRQSGLTLLLLTPVLPFRKENLSQFLVLGWWYPPLGEAEWSLISELDVIQENLWLTTVQCMFGENGIILFKQLDQLLSGLGQYQCQ